MENKSALKWNMSALCTACWPSYPLALLFAALAILPVVYQNSLFDSFMVGFCPYSTKQQHITAQTWLFESGRGPLVQHLPLLWTSAPIVAVTSQTICWARLHALHFSWLTVGFSSVNWITLEFVLTLMAVCLILFTLLVYSFFFINI